jgi:polysaccharide biosynthesis protein VpsQ
MLIILANTGILEPLLELTKKFPHSDKIAHFFLAGILTLMLNIALNCTYWQLGKFRLLKASIIVLIFATLEEGSHYFLQHRTFDLLDLLADYLGIMLFSYLVLNQVCREKTAPPPNGKEELRGTDKK